MFYHSKTILFEVLEVLGDDFETLSETKADERALERRLRLPFCRFGQIFEILGRFLRALIFDELLSRGDTAAPHGYATIVSEVVESKGIGRSWQTVANEIGKEPRPKRYRIIMREGSEMVPKSMPKS